MRRTAASSTSIAAVTWWRWMALRITCGSQVLSKKPSSLPLLTFLGLSLFSQGCASNQALPDQMAAADQRQLETVIRDMRAEAAAIRNEMAATRIAAAKKEAELQELRHQVAELRQARAEQQQAFDAKQTELMTARAERDQLVQAKAEFQAQLAELPQLLRQTAVEAKAAETSVQAR